MDERRTIERRELLAAAGGLAGAAPLLGGAAAAVQRTAADQLAYNGSAIGQSVNQQRTAAWKVEDLNRSSPCAANHRRTSPTAP